MVGGTAHFQALNQSRIIIYFFHEIACPCIFHSITVHSQVMLPRGREMVDAVSVTSKYAVPPASMCDLQALMGDAAVSE